MIKFEASKVSLTSEDKKLQEQAYSALIFTLRAF